MTKTVMRRVRAVSLGFVAAAGVVLLATPHASAAPVDDASQAITTLAGQISSGTADQGFNGTGLGTKEGDVVPVGDGFKQAYTGGTIFWSPQTGARVLYGAVLAKYNDEGGPTGSLLFPTESEVNGPFKPQSRMASFAQVDKPKIYWTPSDGAWVVRGPFSAATDKLGETLGAPLGDLTQDGPDVETQKFANGSISYNKATGEWTSQPADLATQLKGIAIPGMAGGANMGMPGMSGPNMSAPNVPGMSGANMSAPNMPGMSGANMSAPNMPGMSGANMSAPNVDASAPSADTGGFNWWWLLLPLLLLLLLGLLLWWLFKRRRGDGGGLHGPDVTGPGVKGPNVKGPDLKAPNLHAPDVNAPDVNAPNVSGPHVDGGGLDVKGKVTGAAAAGAAGLGAAGYAAKKAFDKPDVDVPDVKGPDIDAPDIDGPDLKAPDVSAPDIDGPDLKAPDVSAPDIDGPDLKAPDVSAPDINAPNVSGSTSEGSGFDLKGKVTGAAAAGAAGVAAAGAAGYAAVKGVGRYKFKGVETDVPTGAHLPLDDPHQVPEGYPIKGNADSGLYHTPDLPSYAQTIAEIWFATEEAAEAGGFVKVGTKK